MSAVELGAIFVNLASDPSQYVALYWPEPFQPSTAANGDVRTNASGRQRVFTRAGRPQSMQLVQKQTTRADIDTLESWVGQIVCVRDIRGRKFFGVYFEVPVEESTLRDEGDVSLTIRSVSVSEAV